MNTKLLKKLCISNGVSGDENSILELIYNEIADYATQIKRDALGNLIVLKKGAERAKNKLLLSAHMDEVGFIVTNITDNGCLSFDQVGGIDRRVVLGDYVTIGKGINGVVAVKPIHLCSHDEQTAIPKYDDMLIDIGAKNKDDALKYVNIGDSISFKSTFMDNGNNIISKALDDRIGCLILIELIKSDLPYDMYFTFVVQEEVGLRGSKTAAYTVKPDFAIVLEATTAADIPGVEDSKQVCKLSKGCVISFMDRRTIYDKQMITCAFNCAKKLNVKAQYKTAVAGGNDAGAIHQSRGGVRTLALSLPCRYLHSPLSVINKDDYDSTFLITKELSSVIAGGSI